MRRKMRLSLTMQGGILFSAVMLCVVIVLVVMLFSGDPEERGKPAPTGEVWAQVLTKADIANLESARDAVTETEPEALPPEPAEPED